MNELTTRIGRGKMLLCVVGACVLLLWLLSPPGQARGAGARNQEEARAAALAAREAWEQQMKEALSAFHGKIDIYLDANEFQAGQPAFAGVQVSGLVSAGSARFIHITNQTNERWRINVEKIVAYQIRKK